MAVFTKRAVDVFAPYDAAGNPRFVDNQDAQVWGTEAEEGIGGAPGGFLTFATKADMDANLNHIVGIAALVTDDPTGSNNWLYRKTGDYGQGSWLRASDNFFNYIADSTVTMDVQRVHPDSDFDFLSDYGEVFACPAPGFARHNIDISIAWQKLYGSQTGTGGLNYLQNVPNLASDSFVDWNNGSDSNNGGINSPFKTVKKAISNSGHTIWLLPGASKEVISADYTDTINANGRPLRIKALVPGTVTFYGRDDFTEEMTWTLSGSAYTATPSGGAKVYSIVWVKSPGQYVPVPYNASQDTGFYWYQDPSTKLITIRAFGKDFTDAATAAEFLIVYLQAENHTFAGLNVLMEDISFFGAGGIISTFDATKTHRPTLFLKNCTSVFALNANAVHSDGGLVVAQDCNIYGSGLDGFNYYFGTDTAQTPCTFLEIDCTVKFCGWMHSSDGIPPDRNNQGSSGHDNAIGIRINGDYGEGGYGQGIADTGSSAKYWMMGTIVRDPYFDYYGSIVDNFPSLHVEGAVWLDNVRAGGVGSQYGLEGFSAAIKTFNCDFQGATASQSLDANSSIADYTPASP